MAGKTKLDDEAPSTQPGDWVGAAKVVRGTRRRSPAGAGVTFFVFRASTDPSLFAIAGKDDPRRLPECPGEGAWLPFKTLKETGEDRVGFSEAEAKSAIRDKGYLIVTVDAAKRRSVA